MPYTTNCLCLYALVAIAFQYDCINYRPLSRRLKRNVTFVNQMSWLFKYTVSQKNDTDVAHYNFNAHEPILVIFGRDIAQWVCCRMVICCPTSPSLCLCTTWGNMHPRNWVFSVMLYTVSKTTLLWFAIFSTFINQFWYFFVDNSHIIRYSVQILFLV